MNNKRGFFPIFIDIRDKHILFVGGGSIAERRIMALLEFSDDIELVAPEVTGGLRELADTGEICWRKQEYSEEFLEKADIVFICTDNYDLNHEIWSICKSRSILVNNCSNHSECDFYFPGVVTQDEIVVAVNAGGKAHKKAAKLRKAIADLIEEDKFDE